MRDQAGGREPPPAEEAPTAATGGGTPNWPQNEHYEKVDAAAAQTKTKDPPLVIEWPALPLDSPSGTPF